MAALFGHGNPLATQVGQLIEKATDGSQASENWAVYMEVCDVINETDDGPKDAVKAFKKRLSQNIGKNHTAVLYTLTCLETCVKNCGKRFHLHVITKDFLGELIKVIGPKYDPPQAVQEKVLSMIQTWADAFRGSSDLKEIEKVYQDLKAKGIEFPMTDLDHMVPIHTPARVHTEPAEQVSRNRGSSTRMGSQRTPVHAQSQRTPNNAQTQPVVTTGPINPTPDQQAKLRSELEIVQGNVRVMSEMLTEFSPNNVDSSDLELLQELNRANRQMQQRIVELLDRVANEEVTNELLRINDDLNNVFLRYERFERYRTGQSGQLQIAEAEEPSVADSQAPPSYDQLDEASNPAVGNLIDLADDNSRGVTRQLEQMSVGAQSVSSTLGKISSMPASNAASQPKTPEEQDFDMFAQSRKSFEQNKEAMGAGRAYSSMNDDPYSKTLGQAVNAKSNPDAMQLQEDILKLQEQETDYDEMEQWLKQQEAANPGASSQAESISSSEFDSFLATRAAGNGDGQQAQRQTHSRNRQLQKDDDDNPLFAL
ncbi:hypothetical protein CHS0354_037387 [Potamilus streckersoni]|uniref:TOM1-like protein 2 n=1 Tax=Potamilus streckersoni TaxID=2493646 RepID=A0AAE0RRJ3_9BIVA|nr:hypothetical protein CHS0354_037387 [Potamilus streckersoni]